MGTLHSCTFSALRVCVPSGRTGNVVVSPDDPLRVSSARVERGVSTNRSISSILAGRTCRFVGRENVCKCTGG